MTQVPDNVTGPTSGAWSALLANPYVSNLVTNIVTNVVQAFWQRRKVAKLRLGEAAEDLDYYLGKLPLYERVTQEDISFLAKHSDWLDRLAYRAEQLTRAGLYRNVQRALGDMPDDAVSAVSEVRGLLLEYRRVMEGR